MASDVSAGPVPLSVAGRACAARPGAVLCAAVPGARWERTHVRSLTLDPFLSEPAHVLADALRDFPYPLSVKRELGVGMVVMDGVAQVPAAVERCPGEVTQSSPLGGDAQGTLPEQTQNDPSHDLNTDTTIKTRSACIEQALDAVLYRVRLAELVQTGGCERSLLLPPRAEERWRAALRAGARSDALSHRVGVAWGTRLCLALHVLLRRPSAAPHPRLPRLFTCLGSEGEASIWWKTLLLCPSVGGAGTACNAEPPTPSNEPPSRTVTPNLDNARTPHSREHHPRSIEDLLMDMKTAPMCPWWSELVTQPTPYCVQVELPLQTPLLWLQRFRADDAWTHLTLRVGF